MIKPEQITTTTSMNMSKNYWLERRIQISDIQASVKTKKTSSLSTMKTDKNSILFLFTSSLLLNEKPYHFPAGVLKARKNTYFAKDAGCNVVS